MSLEEHDVVRAGAELVSVVSSEWATPADVEALSLIMVHGFTGSGRRFRRLGEYFRAHGFCPLIFNYDSYRGIDNAAIELCALMEPLAGRLETFGFVLMAHSMGGLVVRRARQIFPDILRNGFRGLVMLGTPNKGTLAGRKVLSFMIDAAESLGEVHPYLRLPSCPSAEELTLSDGAQLVEEMNKHDREDGVTVPVLSISGGMEFLELGGSLTGRLRNSVLQRLIGEHPNDGLVGETSANFGEAVGGELASTMHRNDYRAYPRTNHTHLIGNQEVAVLILKWLANLTELRRSGKC